MKELLHQMELGLEFEKLSPLDAAVESVTNQYFRDRIDGQINREAWINVAEVHPKFRQIIYNFWISIESSWKKQEEAEFDNRRFEVLESVMLQGEQINAMGNQFMGEAVSSNMELVKDLFWARTPDYYSPGDISEQLDIIFNEITPEAILDDYKGTVEHPVLTGPTDEIIERILKRDVSLTPSFPDENEYLEGDREFFKDD